MPNSRVASVVLFAVAALTYANVLGNGFAQDDFYYIVGNRDLTEAPWRLMASAYAASGVYRPVTMLSYALNVGTLGMKPLGFHLLNLLLHGVVTVLFYRLTLDLLAMPRAAWAAAVLFAVHPIHSEAVAAAVGRAELLAAGFLFAAWLLHLRGRFNYAAVCALLATLSKESAAVFLALIPLSDYITRRVPAHAATVYARYAAAFAAFLALQWRAGGMRGGDLVALSDNSLAHLPAGWRILNALRVAWKYVGLQIYPATLSADYSYNAIPVTRDWLALLPALTAALAVAVVWVWSWRRAAGVAVAFSIYICGFALTANILVAIGTIMGERLAYFPSAGLCLLAGLGWQWLAAQRRALAVALLAAAATALAARTMVRNRDWRNDFTLYAAAVRAVPNSAKARHNLGSKYMEVRDLPRAREQFEAAYRIDPNYPDLLASMGLLYVQLGDKTRALQLMDRAVGSSGRDNPNYDNMATNLAALLLDTGNYNAALSLLNRIVAESPRYARAWSNRAAVHLVLGNASQARADAEQALRLDPASTQAAKVLEHAPK
jgi:tetratricopeptide (TPR) repeat protein